MWYNHLKLHKINGDSSSSLPLNENFTFQICKKTWFPENWMYVSWKFYLFSISHIILEWYWRVWLFPWLLRFTAILLFLLSVTLVWSEVTFFNVQPVLSIFAQMIRSASKGYYYFYVEVSLFWKKKTCRCQHKIFLCLFFIYCGTQKITNPLICFYLLDCLLFTVKFSINKQTSKLYSIELVNPKVFFKY